MKTLKSFEFGASERNTYDWDAILSGKIVQLDEGTDYECKTATFATLARNAAKKRGMTVKTGAVEGGVVVQAIEASREQKAAWAKQDAEKKAEKAAEAAESEE